VLRLTTAVCLTCLLVLPARPAQADKPCDDYPPTKQARCRTLWTQINREAETEMAQFGMAQLKRRQAGDISQEQHMAENFDFIKRSTEKRLRLLKERMAQE